MQSLLRAKLKKKEKGLEGFESPEFEVVMDVISSAMGTLCKSVLMKKGSLEFTEKLFLLERDKCLRKKVLSHTCNVI